MPMMSNISKFPLILSSRFSKKVLFKTLIMLISCFVSISIKTYMTIFLLILFVQFFPSEQKFEKNN